MPDPILRFSLVLLDDFLPASDREENPATALLLQLPIFYPDLKIDAVAGDAGPGYDVFLHPVYANLHARRGVDLRAHQTDQDKTLWPLRGYDDKGRPICVCAYRTTSATPSKPTASASTEGVTSGPASTPAAARPIPSPPSKELPIRLVRDIPVGTPAWKRIYHRARNAAEGRNSTFESWGLKQLPAYGDLRGKALTFQADVWLNLTTLARLVREATAATGA